MEDKQIYDLASKLVPVFVESEIGKDSEFNEETIRNVLTKILFFVISEIKLRIKDKRELEQVLLDLQTRVQTGKNLLDSKGLPNGEKTFIQKDFGHFIKEFDYELPHDLKRFLHPVFMPRNEEEIIRNILSLSSQIKYVRDIPQVFITFDEQTHSHVFFTIALVRVLRPDSLSIQEMFKKSTSVLEYIHDRCQTVGSLRKRYKKEATVFRIKLSKDQFLRADHTIDINRARQTIVSELFHVIGEVRDFNGGMITKQNEVFSELKNLLKESPKYNELLLENFFYSLTPVIMQNVLEIEALRTLFLMLLEAIEDRLFHGENYALKISAAGRFVFAMIKTKERCIRDELSKALARLQLHSSQLAASCVSFCEETYLGYIYRSNDPEGQQKFSYTIQHTLANFVSLP